MTNLADKPKYWIHEKVDRINMKKKTFVWMIQCGGTTLGPAYSKYTGSCLQRMLIVTELVSMIMIQWVT